MRRSFLGAERDPVVAQSRGVVKVRRVTRFCLVPRSTENRFDAGSGRLSGETLLVRDLDFAPALARQLPGDGFCLAQVAQAGSVVLLHVTWGCWD